MGVVEESVEKRRDSANGKEAAKTERRGDKERGREMGRKIANKKRKSPNEAKNPLDRQYYTHLNWQYFVNSCLHATDTIIKYISHNPL